MVVYLDLLMVKAGRNPLEKWFLMVLFVTAEGTSYDLHMKRYCVEVTFSKTLVCQHVRLAGAIL